MINFNETILQQVVNTALDAVAGSKEWQRAIKKAHIALLENPYIHAIDDHTLLIAGDTATYTSNGTCQCTAFLNGKPCYHRAAARLYYRYLEAMKG